MGRTIGICLCSRAGSMEATPGDATTRVEHEKSPARLSPPAITSPRLSTHPTSSTDRVDTSGRSRTERTAAGTPYVPPFRAHSCSPSSPPLPIQMSYLDKLAIRGMYVSASPPESAGVRGAYVPTSPLVVVHSTLSTSKSSSSTLPSPSSLARTDLGRLCVYAERGRTRGELMRGEGRLLSRRSSMLQQGTCRRIPREERSSTTPPYVLLPCRAREDEELRLTKMWGPD